MFFLYPYISIEHIIDIYNDTIIKYDLISNKCNIDSFIPAEYDGDNIGRRYGCVSYYDGKLLLAPLAEHKILVYYLENKSFSSIDFDISNYGNNYTINGFQNIITNGKYMYLIPGLYDCILKVDMESEKVFRIEGNYTETGKRHAGLQTANSGYVLVDNMAYISYWDNNTILKLDLNSDSIKEIKLDLSMPRVLRDIVYDGECFWVTDRDDNCLIKWDEKKGNVEEIDIDLEVYDRTGFMYLFSNGKSLYICPKYGKSIIKYDKQLRTIDKLIDIPYDPIESVKLLPWSGTSFFSKMELCKDIYLYSAPTAFLCKYDFSEDDIVLCSSMNVDADDTKRVWEKWKRRFWLTLDNKLLHEVEGFNISDYIKNVSKV